MGICSHLSIALTSLLILPLWLFTFFAAQPGHSIMRSPSRPVPRQHWAVPVRREETLAVRDQFRKVGWRPPNHKPKTTKLVASAKSLWDRYVVPSDLQAVSRYV